MGSHRIINPEQEKEELKVLEKMGIIQWTEEDHANEEPSNEKTNRTPLSARTDNKTPRDTLKSNRLNFLNSLQECDNLENLSGNVIILSEQRTEGSFFNKIYA